MNKNSVTITFENEKAAQYFATWLCDAGGEDEYSNFMEGVEQEDKEANITAVRFNYWNSPEGKYSHYDIRTECGRLDIPEEGVELDLESKEKSEESLSLKRLAELLSTSTALLEMLETTEPKEEVLTFDTFACSFLDYKLKFKSPLQLHPEKSGQLFYLKYPQLSMSCCGTDLNVLQEDFEEQLGFLWQTYAKECDHKLTKKAQELRYELLKLIEEVPND